MGIPSHKVGRARPRGFTLVELMIAVAIVGILTSLAVYSFDRLGFQEAPRDAALDFNGYLSKARSMAMERGADVWVIIYPGYKRAASDAQTGGNGAYFLYLDQDMVFGSAGCSTPNPCWIGLDPTVATAFTGGNGRLLDKVYLDNYPKKNAKFGLTTTSPAPSIPLPFNYTPGTVTCKMSGYDCSADNRLAIVFDGDGTARFVKNDGSIVAFSPSVATSSGRSAFLSVTGPKTKQNYLFAVNGPTGFIGYYPQQ